MCRLEHLTNNFFGILLLSENSFVNRHNCIYFICIWIPLDVRWCCLALYFNPLVVWLVFLTGNRTIVNDDFIHLKSKLWSAHRHTSFASSPVYTGSTGNICRVKHTHPVLCTSASQELLIHFCSAITLHSSMIIYFHQLKTRKTHLRPLIM